MLIATDLDGTLLTPDGTISPRTRDAIRVAEKAGVPVVPVTARQIDHKIGMPYSDPMMDGTVIQHVTTGALERGVRTRDTLLATEAVAGTGTPCVIMTYWNLVEHYGVDAYARDLYRNGVGKNLGLFVADHGS